MHKNNTNKYFNYLIIITFFLLYLSLFINLGKQPLFLEEPRRGIIAMEMIYNENFIVPTEFGEFYYLKPPLWNWVIIASYKLFGINEFSIRFFSVISFILTGLVLFIFGKKYVSPRFAIYCSLFYYISIDLLFYFSTLGEIDIFYSLICFIAFLSIFHFYEQKKYYLLFGFLYFFSAIGFLTKGFPSIPFLVVSLGVFVLYNRNIKLLFSLSHLAGIVIFIFVLATYFLLYNKYNSLTPYFEILWLKSSERTVIELGTVSLWPHLINFPLESFKAMLPCSVFMFLFIKKGRLQTLKENRYILFAAVIFLSNFIVYWISAGTRQRYIYMLYPLLISVCVYFFYKNYGQNIIITKIIDYVFGFCIAGFIIVTAGLYKFLDPEIINRYKIHVGIFVLIYCLVFLLYLKNKNTRIILFILSFVIARFLFDFIVIPERATNSDAQKHKKYAYEIATIAKNDNVYLFKESVCSRTTIFYLERELGKVVVVSDTLVPGNYYILNPIYYPAIENLYEHPKEIVYEFGEVTSAKKFMLLKTD